MARSDEGREHEVQDYQIQLMNLEQQNKKTLQVAQDEQNEEQRKGQGHSEGGGKAGSEIYSGDGTGGPLTKSSSSKEYPGEKTAWEKGGSQFTNKRYSEYFDPCQDAANRSLKCMRRNGGDRGMCQDYFEAYRECKKSWMEELKEQKRKQGRGWFG